MSAWSQSATSSSTTSIAPSPPAPASAVQRVWDNQSCEVQADQLLDAASDHVERARYLASRAPGPGDWLHTLPLSSIGQNGQRYRPHCVCDSVLQSCDHTYVYAELRSQSIVIMDYLVAMAQDDIHATIKSTRYCVVHLTPPVLMQLESHIRSVVVMTRDQMGQLRFRGRGAVVLPGTPHHHHHHKSTYSALVTIRTQAHYKSP